MRRAFLKQEPTIRPISTAKYQQVGALAAVVDLHVLRHVCADGLGPNGK
jgi:hypothetical protein